MIHTATYSPEDDKIRIYPACRLPQDEYRKLKSVGYGWAPKQECFYAVWSPKREDAALEMCDEITDEDKSLVERAEERADRFGGYSANRERDADQYSKGVHAISDNIPFGQPILVGHHSERRARRDAEKMENGMRKAVKMWETSEYWKRRAAGALAAAKYKEQPGVRARRIKGLVADLRRYRAEFTPCSKTVIMQQPFHESLKDKDCPKVAHVLCGQGRAKHWVQESRLKAIEESYSRSIAHVENRIAYETAMLEEQGAASLLDKKPRPKQLPLLNYRSPNGILTKQKYGFSDVRNVTLEQVEMTSDEYKKVYDDYKGTRFDAAKTHRIRIVLGFGYLRSHPEIAGDEKEGYRYKRLAVFITDSKAHPVPKATEPETTQTMPDPEAAPERPTEALKQESPKQEEVDMKIEQTNLFDGVQGDLFANAAEETIEQVSSPEIIKNEEESTESRIESIKKTLKDGIKPIEVIYSPGFYPTPSDLAERMVEKAELKPGQSVLEPSAGSGNIIRAIVEEGGCSITSVEINTRLFDHLRETFEHMTHINSDFLSCNGNLAKFDRVIMNPPFEGTADIKHIQRAVEYLKPGGRLVAICAGGPRQERELKPMADTWEELPAGTFKDAGTMVNSVLLTINK